MSQAEALINLQCHKLRHC